MSEKIDVINLWELEARARRRMRLVHVMTVPTSLAFLRGQLGYMKAHGFDVAVVSSPGEPLEEFGAEQGVETVAVDMPRKITPLRDPARRGEALEADPRIHWKGGDWNTPPLYAAMDIVVLPTYREGFPNVPLEAAAMELPTVATRIAGCTDAIEDGVTGLLGPPAMPWRLPRRGRRYIESAELRRRHGRRHASGSRACFARSGSGRHYTTSISACSRRAADWLLNEEPDHAPGDLRGSAARSCSAAFAAVQGNSGLPWKCSPPTWLPGCRPPANCRIEVSRSRRRKTPLNSPSSRVCQGHRVDVAFVRSTPKSL